MEQIKIGKLLMQETGTYNSMFQRPYVTFLDGVTMDNLLNRLDVAKNGLVTGDLLAGISGSMMSPSASPGNEILIPQGWGERRVRFLIEVYVTTNTGSTYIYYFQGYTSHLGVSDSGNIDPKMEFHINSFLRVTRSTQYAANGLVAMDVVTESAHVINGAVQYDFRDNSDQYTMRPHDVFTGMQSSHLEEAYNYHGDEAVGLTDTRLVLTDPIRSNRENNVPSKFIAKMVTNYNNGVMLNEFGQSETDIMDRCRHMTNETNLSENSFIRSMANIKGYGNGTDFTFSDLEILDPDVTRVTNYLTVGASQARTMNVAGQSAYWNDASRDTVVATMLSNSIPAIMMELMISKIYFRTTNLDSQGMINTVIIDGKSLTSADIAPYFAKFKLKLEREILPDVSFNNQEMFAIDMSVDLFGDTVLNLSLNGAPNVMYTTPSFCDSLISPIVTNDKTAFYSTVNDFEVLINQLGNVNTAPSII